MNSSTFIELAFEGIAILNVCDGSRNLWSYLICNIHLPLNVAMCKTILKILSSLIDSYFNYTFGFTKFNIYFSYVK